MVFNKQWSGTKQLEITADQTHAPTAGSVNQLLEDSGAIVRKDGEE